MPMKSETAEAFDSAAFLKQVTEKPGVYQMYDANGDILYVGKASNLRKRLASYFRKQGQAIKTQSLVSRIADIQVTVTASETEALLLEQNLIKSQRPPYNILLRDDKSYPYIYLSNHSDYPSLTFRRGKSKRDKGTFFGPFPSGGAVRESLNILQKVFRIRNCSESYFRNRTRPCLQYQINRCTAPCVGMISPEDYQQDVRRARLFLQGKNPEIIQELMDAMEQASTSLDFERAAQFRDQINYLRHVQEQQAIEGGSAELDVIGLSQEAGVVCVVVLSVRGGRIVGTQHFFPRLSMDQEESELITAFIGQFYLGEDNPREIPREIIVAEEIPDREVLDQALSNQAGRDTRVRHRVRDERRRWLQMARTNAEETLRSHLSNKETVYRRLLALRELLEMDEIPARMECFDISHSQGENTVASCVVFDENGPLKSDYRLYNIEGETAGDDYAAMGQVLRRRYRRIKAGDGKRPDLVFIDGGLGQLNVARTVFDELGIDDITLIGVAKGEARRAGMEELIEALTENRFRVPPDSPALHLIQHIRDEAHRFAITGHRQRRDKKRSSSTLEGIPGVGPRRRRDLINYFGGLQELRKASVGEIAKVRGISETLAESIHSALHNE
ncbi:excinuclease ABC subunit UvrC [Halomonas sp. 22501_18_FS]|jgi:excinuclease ABC subunit C|uniref:UvrABC system protein C n=2 Tax=Oceanospirillales TaxID=135619 RepID=A0A9X4YBL1_9GAMM|nr:excinuclease ABC subunit UvrC [Halospina sp. K52047b]KAA8984517.1 excinuclease ABC subunit UvrC [Halospina sp. K52047b]MYL26724.1 excinuclease ABC subunit UvrC [Halomonas utahensis]MYL75541.1 excinuclease ABC subunit UvrC [Halomonas sp. 22501_18_FS]